MSKPLAIVIRIYDCIEISLKSLQIANVHLKNWHLMISRMWIDFFRQKQSADTEIVLAVAHSPSFHPHNAYSYTHSHT